IGTSGITPAQGAKAAVHAKDALAGLAQQLADLTALVQALSAAMPPPDGTGPPARTRTPARTGTSTRTPPPAGGEQPSGTRPAARGGRPPRGGGSPRRGRVLHRGGKKTRMGGDSEGPADIPIRGTDIAAGYVTGPGKWPAKAYQRFRRIEHARIDCRGTKPEKAEILDVEEGCSDVHKAVTWVKKRKAAFPGAYPPIV